jgi:hypothetical protein
MALVVTWAKPRSTLPQPEHLDPLVPKELMMDYANNKLSDKIGKQK